MDKIIATEKDKLGDLITICFCKGEESPPYVTTFFLRHLADLIENGHSTNNFIPTLAEKRIIYLKLFDEVIAHIVWEWHGNSTYIVFTAVSDNYKNRGLYAMLHHYYEERIKNSTPPAQFSKSQLHVNNNRIVELSKKNGYEIEYYKMIKKL
jgi:hypothetical protein